MDNHGHFPWFTVGFGFFGSLVSTFSSSGALSNFYLKAFVGGMLGVLGGFILKFVIKYFFPRFYRYVNDKSNNVCDE